MAPEERAGLHPLLLAALEADDAFQAAVVEHYGARNAGDARYRYDHPPHIRALAEAMRAACDAWLPIARRSLIPRVARAAVVVLSLALPAGALEQQTCGADAFGAGGGCVNVNTATVEELAHLHRVGGVTAERIVAEREAAGPFATLGELALRVKGVGPLTVCYNQRALLTRGETTRSEGYKPEPEVVEACRAAEQPADYCHDC